MVIQMGNVSASAMPTNTQAARNLPSTACHSVTGCVSSSSMLPLRRSSAHRRMDTAGHQEQVQPGQEAEERREVRLAALEQRAEGEGEQVRHQQEDDDEHVGDGSGEITRELAPQDDCDGFQGSSWQKWASGRDGAEHVVEAAGRRARLAGGGRVVGHELAARDDDGARAHGVDLFEDVRGDDDGLLACAISPISVRTSCFCSGSRPSVGSSRISTFGSCMMACARPTRRLKPLDSVSMVCCSTGSSCSRPMT